MLNPITELAAVEFLVFYATLIAATALLCRWWSRLGDTTASLPVPRVPSPADPYEIAYLRGGEREVMKAVIAGLDQRGYVRLDSDAGTTFQQAPDPPDAEKLRALERSVFDWFAQPRTTGEVHSELPGNLLSHCLPYEEKFQQEQLLTSDEAGDSAKLACPAGTAVIVVVGALRAWVGLASGMPIGFLLDMGLIGCIVLWECCEAPRLSDRGRRYLEGLSRSLTWLKRYPVSSTTTTFGKMLRQPIANQSDFLLLVGVFGLEPAGYSFLDNTLGPGKSGGAGGCGDDGDGGCGGCGGCG